MVFFNDPATTEIYTLSLHDALPILRARRIDRRRHALQLDRRRLGHAPRRRAGRRQHRRGGGPSGGHLLARAGGDRKSTRLNSSHANISYAVFCLQKKELNSRKYIV